MNGYPVTLDQVQDPKDRELRERKAREKIAEYLSHFHNGKLRATTLFSKVKILGNLAEQYVVLGEVEPMREHLHSLIKAIREDLPKIEELKPEHLNSIMWWFRRAHVFLAPHEFPAYLKVMEWGFPEENKFFANRICVMGEWAKELEKLEFGEYDLLGLSAPPRSGKGSPLSEPILTPNGWKTMGQIHAGSKVIGSDGLPAEVLEVYPQGKMLLAVVRLRNGSFTKCTWDHLWRVIADNQELVIETRDLLKLYKEDKKVLVPIWDPISKAKAWEFLEAVDPTTEIEECQCILVNTQDHMYITKDYILTHNTGIGSLFLTWLMGRHPEKSMLFATHTGRMARKEFLDIYNLITDPRRCWNEIFRGLEVNKSAEDLWIDVTPKKAPNNYKTFYCTSIDAQKAGVMEASHLIYCDDLIGGIEEAMNPVRLDTAWEKYTTDILQRKNGFVKILHIATRWSVRDPLTRIADTNENNPRAKFICVPGLNEDGKSNFNFKHNPLDTQHFMTLKESMDPVSFACIVQQSPVERDGIVFTKDSLSYYDGVLPGTEPDEIVFSADIAFGGGDYLCMLIAYVYGMDVYVHDVVYSKGTKEETRPLVVSAIMAHGCSRGFMEANAGGEDYADNISARLKKEGYRCLIESKRAPVTKTKLNRILEAQSEIKANITDGSGFRLHFLSPRTAPRTPMYEEYMRHLTTFNQGAKFVGKQKDDAADATASLVTNVLYRHSKSPTLQIIRGNILAL